MSKLIPEGAVLNSEAFDDLKAFTEAARATGTNIICFHLEDSDVYMVYGAAVRQAFRELVGRAAAQRKELVS